MSAAVSCGSALLSVWQRCRDSLRRAAGVALESAQIGVLEAGMRLGRQEARCPTALVARRSGNPPSLLFGRFVEHGPPATAVPGFLAREARAFKDFLLRETSYGTSSRNGRHLPSPLRQLADLSAIQSIACRSVKKPVTCSVRPSGHVTSTYHPAPVFGGIGRKVGRGSLIGAI
jgi:hypothetical protein